MFIIKYHKKGYPTKYFGNKKQVANKSCAMAFGEGFREQAEKIFESSETASLVTIPVSVIGEIMYHDSHIPVRKIPERYLQQQTIIL